MSYTKDEYTSSSSSAPSAPPAPPSLLTQTGFFAEPTAPVAVPVSDDALPSRLDRTIQLPVIIAVKKQSNVTIDTVNPARNRPTLKTLLVGDNRQKQRFIHVTGNRDATESYISTIGIDFRIALTEYVRYQVFNVAPRAFSFIGLEQNYFRDAHIILLFGQEDFQQTIASLPAACRSSFDFHTVQGDQLTLVPDLDSITEESLHTTYIAKENVDAFLDEIVFNAMPSRYVVEAVPVDEPTPPASSWLNSLLGAFGR